MRTKFFVILYICNISEITAFLIKFVFIVRFRSLNKIDECVRVQKDQTEHTQKNNIVYIFFLFQIQPELRRSRYM